MNGYLARDRSGALHFFFRTAPARHTVTGQWKPRPATGRGFIRILPDEETKDTLMISWEDSPVYVEMSFRIRRAV